MSGMWGDVADALTYLHAGSVGVGARACPCVLAKIERATRATSPMRRRPAMVTQ